VIPSPASIRPSVSFMRIFSVRQNTTSRRNLDYQKRHTPIAAFIRSMVQAKEVQTTLSSGPSSPVDCLMPTRLERTAPPSLAPTGHSNSSRIYNFRVTLLFCLWKTLHTVHHHPTCHLHTYFPASTTNSVSYHCGRPSIRYTIIPTVICTHIFQRPPPTPYPTIAETPQPIDRPERHQQRHRHATPSPRATPTASQVCNPVTQHHITSVAQSDTTN
jgi:hypothetical protein